MVVMIIVGIPAAVAIPIMQGRIDSAKWSEERAIMGIIARSLRSHIAEKGNNFTPVPIVVELGSNPGIWVAPISPAVNPEQMIFRG
jgi:type II secretory pathway pseudopilin PulG